MKLKPFKPHIHLCIFKYYSSFLVFFLYILFKIKLLLERVIKTLALSSPNVWCINTHTFFSLHRFFLFSLKAVNFSSYLIITDLQINEYSEACARILIPDKTYNYFKGFTIDYLLILFPQGRK